MFGASTYLHRKVCHECVKSDVFCAGLLYAQTCIHTPVKQNGANATKIVCCGLLK